MTHVVVLGAGFGGLYAARALRRAPVQLTVIDRRNHHLFQPMLYQVATAGLNPSDIAAPIRSVLRDQPNAEVMLAEVTAIDAGERLVRLKDGGRVVYDYLVVAPGARHSYFGHDDWEPLAPGLKNLEDAQDIRRRILLAFERAERPWMLRFLRNVWDAAARYQTRVFSTTGWEQRLQEEHHNLLEACRRRDAAGAIAIMDVHRTLAIEEAHRQPSDPS